jgi:hypothetical protein
MPDSIVTLWRYRDLPEALFVRAKLQAAGIECFLADENIIRLDWFWSNAFGGIRLQLLEEDVKPAMDILSQDIPPILSAEEVGQEYVQPRCPNCNSLDVRFEEYSGISLLVLYVFSLPVPIHRNYWKCEECGQKWRETD